MKRKPAQFDERFLRELGAILRSTSIVESYDAAGRVTGRKEQPFPAPWQLDALYFDPEAGRRRAIAVFSSAGVTVTATIDASDFGRLVRKRTRNRAWNTSRYRDLAVHVSILIEEQIVCFEPAELAGTWLRIRSPADR